jgi:release factor glutamine methyltransferase
MKNKNILSYVASLSHALERAYDDPVLCEQYAWWMLEAITEKNKTTLLTRDHTIAPEQETTIQQWLEALIKEKKPIQYLIGTVPFGDLEILVKPPVLIPRPETEEWCNRVISQLHALEHKQFSILDMCCGSGCIALALARAFPHAAIFATDISPRAIELTKQNCVHNNVHNVEVIESDLFNTIPPTMHFDIIVSNPPYIAPQEWTTLDDSVTGWEDRNALIADDSGLAIIKRIIEQAPHYIKQNAGMKEKGISQVILEIGYQQGTAVKNLMLHAGYNDIVIDKDLEGKDRVVRARVDNVAISKA